MTPLTAIRNPDGQMYLREQNPFEHPPGEIPEPNSRYWDFNRTHPPIIALFKCEEGQQFFEGVDIEKVWQYFGADETGLIATWISAYKKEYHVFSWNGWSKQHELEGLSTRQAFQLIEQKERGKEAEEWIHPDEAAIGSLNDDLKAITEQRDELLEALQELVDLMQGVIDGDYKPDSFTLQPAKSAINKALNKTS